MMDYEYQEGRGSVITFIHGMGEDRSFQGRQIRYVNDLGYPFLAVDLEGCGRTLLPKERVTIRRHADNLERILDKENIEKTHLVGFSLGGTVSLEFAYRHPERVDKMCLISLGLYDCRFLTKKIRLARLLIKLKIPKILAYLDRKPREKLVDLSQRSAHDLSCIFNAWKNTSLAGFNANIQAFIEYGVPDYLSEIEAETLIIYGTKDQLLKPNLAEYLVKELPNARLEKIKGKHQLPLSHSDEVNESLAELFALTNIT